MSETWMEVDGVRCEAKLTKTRIVVSFSPGKKIRWGAFVQSDGLCMGFFDFAQRTPEFPKAYARWNGEWHPTFKTPSALYLDRPESWPPCSADVRAFLEAQRTSYLDLLGTRDAKFKAKAVANMLFAERNSAREALIQAAVSGDDEAILRAAHEVRRLAGTSS